jgi:hypothetical protein
LAPFAFLRGDFLDPIRIFHRAKAQPKADQRQIAWLSQDRKEGPREYASADGESIIDHRGATYAGIIF